MSTTIELVLFTPVLLVVLSFLVLAGRLASAHSDVTAAARDAARAASLAQSYPAAVTCATETAGASLADQDITCAALTVTLGDPATFVPGGEVAATVSCEVTLTDLLLPGIPGHRSVAATSVEVIDRFRSTG